MSRHRPGVLTAKQEQAILALLTYAKVSEAAASIGVAERTLWSWQAMPHFKKAYEKAKEKLIAETQEYIQLESMKSVQVIAHLRDSADTSDQVKLKAAHIFANRIIEPKQEQQAPQQGSMVVDPHIIQYATMQELEQAEQLAKVWTERMQQAEGMKEQQA